MKKLMLSLAFGAFMLLPGDTSGFPRPVAHPAYRPAPVPVHTPAYVAPRPVAPVYHPAYRPPVAAQPAYRPPVVQPIVRPPVVARPPVAVQPIIRPPVVQPIVRPPAVGIGNRPVVVNRTVLVNRGIYVNRGSTYYRPGYSYYHNYYDGWHHGYWNGWYNRPWLWFGAGVTAGWLYATTPAAVYANPYWVAPSYAPVYDYGQSIPVPQPVPVLADQGPPDTDAYDPTLPPPPQQSAPPPPQQQDDPNAAGAAKLLDDGRQSFLASDYDGALKTVDQAISAFPKDATLHEFRALVLFAQRRYQDAAATIYAVLAVGPGWDWPTMNSFYRDPQIYTAQLRALENYTKANPKDAGARFLLAYHYLTTDYRDSAISTLRSVVALQPNDQLAAYLLKMLENKDQPGGPAPGM